MTSVTRCISDKRNLFLKSKKYSWNACLSHLIVMYFKPQKIPFSWRILRTCLDCVLHKILDDNSKYWDQNKHETLHSWVYYLNILFKLYSKLVVAILFWKIYSVLLQQKKSFLAQYILQENYNQLFSLSLVRSCNFPAHMKTRQDYKMR